MAGRMRGRTGRGWDAAPPGTRAQEPARAERAQPNAAELAREICLRQLAVRPRTRTELAAALRRRGIPSEVAAEVLERYAEVGIVDDGAFASAWVSSRHHGKGLARRVLAGELRRKGVDSAVVDGALEELADETEAETARLLVARKLRGTRSDRPDAMFRRLVAMLARKGYPAGVAIQAVKDAMVDWDGADDLAGALDADAIEADFAAAEEARGDAAEGAREEAAEEARGQAAEQPRDDLHHDRDATDEDAG